MKDEQHPAQGLISLARAYGDLSCFGSDIKLGSYINLSIDTATKHRNNIGDRYSSQKSIIQVRLTYHQFAELITSFGRGDGVPCTIEAVNGKRIEQYENADSTIVDFKTDHDAVLEEIGKQISSLREQLEAISESSRVRKKDVTSLASLASQLHTNFEHNLSYVQERFDEQMELKYHRMSIEVTSLFENRVHNLGLQSIELQKIEEESSETLLKPMKGMAKKLPQVKDSDRDPGRE